MKKEGWDGTERRVNTALGIEEVKNELQTVREALYSVAEGMSAVIPRPEVEELVLRERRDRFRVTLILASAIAVVTAFVIFSVVQMTQLRTIAEQNNMFAEDLEDFNVELGEKAAEGHATITNNLRCLGRFFLTPIEERTIDVFEDCFEEVPLAPARPNGS